MTDRGFTLVELLLATVITLLVVGAGLAMAGAARWSLAVEPATIDTFRRAREGVMALADAIADAGGGVAMGDGSWALDQTLPVVRPLTALDGSPGARFTAIGLLRTVPGAVGRLALAHTGPGGSLTLDRAAPCPRSTPVCGFRVDDVAVVFDGRGRFDVFQISAVSDALARLTPPAALSRAYGEGAWVVAARADRFGLVRQVDGSQTLTRLTFAGASEPLVDGVVDLEVVPWGRPDVPGLRDADEGPGLASWGLMPPPADEADDDEVFADGEHCMVYRSGGRPRSRLSARVPGAEGLARLAPFDFADGPWCPLEGAAAAFDADLLRVQRIDIRMRVEVLSAEFRGPAGRLFARGGTATLAAPRWIQDRIIAFSVGLANR